MLSFPFNNPVKKNISDYVKLSNDISIQKLKKRHSEKLPYKINYDLTLSDYENTNKNKGFNGNLDSIVNNNLDINCILVSLVETLVVFSITFVIYKNI